MKGPFNKKIGAVLLAGVAVVALVWLRVSVGEVNAARALGELRRVQGQWWALPAFFGAYLALTTALVPSGLLHMASGAAYGFREAIWINLAYFQAAANLQFFAARRAGRERVAGFLELRGIRALDEVSKTHGLLGVVLIRFLPIPGMVVATGLGVSPVRWRDYAAGSLIGGFPYIVVYTYFAAALVEGTAGAEREARWRVAIATAVVLALAVGTAAVRARVARSARSKA
ncbi:MAG TPA: VTT domain-containing protein [Myxococcaceae bacterium]|nr:VTT domain-containing protein [Myxococcaceae bacterium]